MAAAKKSAVAIGCRHAFVFAAGSSLLVHLVHSAASLVAQGLFPTPTSHYHWLFPCPVPLQAFAYPISPIKQPGLVYCTRYRTGYIAVVTFTMALSANAVGVLTGGQVMSLALYSAFVGSSIQGCVTAWSDISRSVAAAGDMLQLLLRSPSPLLTSPLDYQAELTRFKEALKHQEEQEATVTMPAAVGSARRKVPAVEFRDVWLSYPDRGGRWALKGLSFQVPPGSLVAVTGKLGPFHASCTVVPLRDHYVSSRCTRGRLDGNLPLSSNFICPLWCGSTALALAALDAMRRSEWKWQEFVRCPFAATVRAPKRKHLFGRASHTRI